MSIFALIKGIIIAITMSIVKYPSNIFWLPSMITLITFLYTFTSLVLKSNSLFGNIKFILDMFNNPKISNQFIMVSLSCSFFMVLICRYYKNYYQRSHKNSEPEIKAKLNGYLVMFTVITALYVIFINLSVLLSKPIQKHGNSSLKTIQFISYVCFVCVSPIAHIIPRSIVRLKHPTKAIPGFSLITLQFLMNFIAITLVLFEKIFGAKYLLLDKLIAISSVIGYNANGFSFVFDAMAVLGHRFIKYFKYIPRPKPQALRANGKMGV